MNVAKNSELEFSSSLKFGSIKCSAIQRVRKSWLKCSASKIFEEGTSVWVTETAILAGFSDVWNKFWVEVRT